MGDPELNEDQVAVVTDHGKSGNNGNGNGDGDGDGNGNGYNGGQDGDDGGVY